MNGFSFKPENERAQSVPFFEDANSEEGWQGHRTRKSIDKLMNEVTSAIGRLGGIVSGFQRGTFHTGQVKRNGYQIHYALRGTSGQLVSGRLDLAALPVRYERNQDDALEMALYMVRTALDGMWFMQRLSPGYAPLMPWMLADGERTVSQLWAESPIMSRLLPPGSSDFVEGEIVE